ncbi:MAG: hypothetical protein ACJAYX_005010 [Planctomycetota bacterium]|jgi:hypothetical protein
MRNHLLVLASLVLMAMPACTIPTLEVQAGYAQLSLDGDIGYSNGNSIAVEQDVESAFGLGDTQGSPYGRAQIDFGVPVLTVSAFSFEDEGQGRLGEGVSFGNIPGFVGGVPVQSQFDLMNAKVSYAFEIGLGPVSISPGLAIDYFDLQIDVTDAFSIAREQVDVKGPLPLAFLRAEVDLGIVSAFAEAGYISAEIDDVDGEVLDIEAQLVVHPTPLIELFVGYRYVNIVLDGLIEDDTIDTDLTVSGLIFGGGIRF